MLAIPKATRQYSTLNLVLIFFIYNTFWMIGEFSVWLKKDRNGKMKTRCASEFIHLHTT